MMAARSRIAPLFVPLITALVAEERDAVLLSFTAIEELIGAPLPMRLRVYSAAWTQKTQSIARALSAAGWRGRLDYPGRRVIFRRVTVEPEA
jgi:hypothetical protein